MVHHLTEVDIHIEFYPDLATVIQILVAPNLTPHELQNWTDNYVTAMSKARELTWDASNKVNEASLEILSAISQ
ncbi:MAG: hypothetical protein Roseis2KO_12760 [Roseivirga sp.]